MRLKEVVGAALLVAAVGVLADRAIQGPPELVLVWLCAALGVAIQGVTLLRLADDDRRLATAAIVRHRPELVESIAARRDLA